MLSCRMRSVSSIGTANRRKGLLRLAPQTAPHLCQIGSPRHKPHETQRKQRFREPIACVVKCIPYLALGGSEALTPVFCSKATHGPTRPQLWAMPTRFRAV